MRTAIASILCIIVFPVVLVAQQSPFRGAQERFISAEGNLDYLSPLQYLLKNEQAFDENMYSQALATYYSFVGESAKNRTNSPSDPGGFNMADAYKVILPKAKASSVVLFNEAHDTPAHRAFALAMLDSLYAAGYRILALEALSEQDTAVNSRGFAVASSGFYTREPHMANLVRAAIAKGYRVVGHEIRHDQGKEFTDPIQRSNHRDSMQAVNLRSILESEPDAKIVGLVGYDHILEKERDGFKRLATYLKEGANIDALTIDQTTDCSCLSSSLKLPAVLSLDGKAPTTIGYNKDYVDIQVVHPPVTTVNGRPGWLFSYPGRRAIQVELPSEYSNKRCLVQLYSKAEFEAVGKRAIPVDQLISNPGQSKLSMLAPVIVTNTVVKYTAFN